MSLASHVERADSADPQWVALLRASTPQHIVQIYRDDVFCVDAIATFVIAGLHGHEAVILLIATPHWDALAGSLQEAGFDIAMLLESGQLVVAPAEDIVESLHVGGSLSSKPFETQVQAIVSRARADGRFSAIRLYGEVVNILTAQGEFELANELEELGQDVSMHYGMNILCSYAMDNFSYTVHRHSLPMLSKTHSHLIPVADYGRLDAAVHRALSVVFAQPGHVDSILALSKLSSLPPMPLGERALFLVREMFPREFPKVLQVSKMYYYDVAPTA